MVSGEMMVDYEELVENLRLLRGEEEDYDEDDYEWDDDIDLDCLLEDDELCGEDPDWE